ncbi:hypothetical protein MRX96_035589 [Rhipicephalus microplus]
MRARTRCSRQQNWHLPRSTSDTLMSRRETAHRQVSRLRADGRPRGTQYAGTNYRSRGHKRYDARRSADV